jgi:predicted ATPase/Flp pilus assembly protein TadD
MGDLASEPSAAGHAVRLEQARLTLIEDRVEARMALGQIGAAVAELELLAAQHPLRERVAAQLMLALFRSGRQADASAVYQRTRARLVDELGMEPGPELQEALRRVLQHDPGIGLAARRTLASPPANLPAQQTSFIGRQTDLPRLVGLLSKARLVTLTGFGGTGKTRLAVRVAADLVDNFADGVWFVDLAPIVDPQLLPQVVARALGIREQPGRSLLETVIEYLKSKKALLVLDNCEHLVAAAAGMAERLLASCPDVHFLITSRQRLHIDGEQVYPVPPLPLPSAQNSIGLAEIMASDAVRLFVERASMVVPSFTIHDRNAPAIAKLCQQLDGIPLALELAAAQIAAMTPADMLERMDERFRILTTGRRTGLPRHQTLLATVEWSHQLLSEPEQCLFRRLAIFAGGFDLSAAESICADASIDVPVLGLLSGLVDKSLVIAEEGALGHARYRLLETLREFGRQQLGQGSEDESVRERHADYFLHIADDAEHQLRGPQAESQLAVMELEHDNVRAALDWSIKHDGDLALRVASAWSPFWFARGHLTEGREWLSTALQTSNRAALRREKSSNGAAHFEVISSRGRLTSPLSGLSTVAAPTSEDRGSRIRAEALRHSGNLAFHQGDVSAARQRYEEALAIGPAIDSPLHAALLNGLGMVSSDEGALDDGRSYYERSLEVAERCGDVRGQAVAVSNLGACAWTNGDFQTARTLKLRAAELMKHEGDRVFMAVTLLWLGRIAGAEGQIDEAESLMRRGLNSLRDMKEQMWTAMGIEMFGHLASLKSQPGRALRLGGAFEAHLEKIGSASLWSSSRPEAEAHWQRMRDLLGPESSRLAWDAGRLMSVEDAVAYALAESAEVDVLS